jgi:hypothetical protein
MKDKAPSVETPKELFVLGSSFIKGWRFEIWGVSAFARSHPKFRCFFPLKTVEPVLAGEQGYGENLKLVDW